MDNIKVIEYLKKFNMENKIITLPKSIATVSLAAQNLNCEEARIAKTLSFKLSKGCILIVTAGDMKIDNGKYKAEFNEKAQMLKIDEVEEIIGHPVGGVCPFAVNDDVKIYLDISLKRFNTVYPACGSTNSAIELTPNELETITNYPKWIDVCKSK